MILLLGQYRESWNWLDHFIVLGPLVAVNYECYEFIHSDLRPKHKRVLLGVEVQKS